MKLIFFDIDGTLIPDGSIIIPESAREAIRTARKQGHICMINTGRTKCMVGKELLEQVEFDGCLLGCGTMGIYRGRELFHDSFSVEQSERIIDGLRRHKVDAILEGSENDYSDLPENMHSALFRDYMQNYKKFQFASYEMAPGKYDKLYAYVEEQKAIQGFCEEFQDELDFIDREQGFYEIVPRGRSKASGMEHIAELLQIPMKDTVAIGDSNNDLSMLQCAGIGIAMGNSTQNILDIADYVTTNVEADGIWNALQWLGVLN